MKQEIKRRYKEIDSKSKGITRIAISGECHSGKTTSILDLVTFSSRIILNRIILNDTPTGIITSFVPIRVTETEADNIGIKISLSDGPMSGDISMERAISPILKIARIAIREKLVRSTKNFNDEDLSEIIEMIIKPQDGSYDISEFCTEEIYKSFRDAVNHICTSILAEDGEKKQRSLDDEIKIRKGNANSTGKTFNRKAELRHEIDYRMDLYGGIDTIMCIESVLSDVVSDIRDKMIEEIENIMGDDIEIVDNSVFVFSNEKTLHQSLKLIDFLYKTSGRNLLISEIMFIIPMSAMIVQKFDSKLYVPHFKIYDLEGLNGDLYCSLEALKSCKPDAVVLFKKADCAGNGFDDFSSRVFMEIGKSTPVYKMVTFADVGIKSRVRNIKNSDPSLYSMSDCDDMMSDEKCINEAYNRFIEANSSEGFKDNYFCSYVEEESEKIDVIPGTNKLFEPERLANLIADICHVHNSKYQEISADSDSVIPYITFNEEKLMGIVAAICKGNTNNAVKAYLSQKNYEPGFQTVSTWKSMHRVGSGYRSEEIGWDNIDINIFNFISGFINKEEIINAIEIDSGSNLSEAEKETVLGNIRSDIENRYFGFLYHMKMKIIYDGIKDILAFADFKISLEQIAKKISDEEYVKNMIIEALSDYKDVFIK